MQRVYATEGRGRINRVAQGAMGDPAGFFAVVFRDEPFHTQISHLMYPTKVEEIFLVKEMTQVASSARTNKKSISKHRPHSRRRTPFYSGGHCECEYTSCIRRWTAHATPAPESGPALDLWVLRELPGGCKASHDWYRSHYIAVWNTVCSEFHHACYAELF